jgi:hypothetical protein
MANFFSGIHNSKIICSVHHWATCCGVPTTEWPPAGEGRLRLVYPLGHITFTNPPLDAKSLKVHKIEIFFGFDFEICIISFLIM